MLYLILFPSIFALACFFWLCLFGSPTTKPKYKAGSEILTLLGFILCLSSSQAQRTKSELSYLSKSYLDLTDSDKIVDSLFAVRIERDTIFINETPYQRGQVYRKQRTLVYAFKGGEVRVGLHGGIFVIIHNKTYFLL